MTEYLRTGQAAKELGVSSHHIRRLCESGEIAAELTHGQRPQAPSTRFQEGLTSCPLLM